MNSIAVFCGSKKGNNPAYAQAADEFGELLAKENIALVYGGGKVGLMGVLADAVMRNGGSVTGVIPEKLMDLEVGHADITSLRVVKDMHERKAMLNQLSDGFLCLPGGIGTLEEIFEVYTWSQIGYHSKPCALLNVSGFYDPLMKMLDFTTEEGFMSEATKQELLIDSDPEILLKKMKKACQL
ncbi:MAG: TIGR00730 family Rossman fold protein [Cyclobacteriaceae bacterium]